MDWLLIFGLPIDRILQLQLLLPPTRTFILDQTLYGQLTVLMPLAEIALPTADLMPLVSLLRVAASRSVSALPGSPSGAFTYARIGAQDAFAFPELLPGSVVRIETRRPQQFLPALTGEISHAIFFIEHDNGFLCSRVRRIDKDRILPHTTEIPYVQAPLTIGRDCVLRGVVDYELRPLNRLLEPTIPRDQALPERPKPLFSAGRASRLGPRLQMARRRSGLHLREASARTAIIAQQLGSSKYFISTASLSSYETSSTLPGDPHRIISLCILYAVSVPALLAWAGISPNGSDQEPIPEALFHPLRGVSEESKPAIEFRQGGVLRDLLSRSDEIPYFLGGSLPELTGLFSPSLRDFFWMAANRFSFHPYLQEALLIAVNRRAKFPPRTVRGSPSREPLYVLLERSGKYLCGRCTLEGEYLLLHPFANGFPEPMRFRNRVDGEVVGQVTMVARRIV